MFLVPVHERLHVSSNGTYDTAGDCGSSALSQGYGVALGNRKRGFICYAASESIHMEQGRGLWGVTDQ